MIIAIIILTVLLSAQLWRMGGDGNKLWRMLGVPAVIALAKLTLTLIAGGFSWLTLALVALYAPSLWLMLTLFSYGLSAPPHKFWVYVFGKGSSGNYLPVEIATRATCGFFWSLAALTFAFATGAWGIFIGYVVFLTVWNGLVGGLVKDVEWSERLVGAGVALAVLV